MKNYLYMPKSLNILAHETTPNQALTPGSNILRWIMLSADSMNQNLEAKLPEASLVKCNVATWENQGSVRDMYPVNTTVHGDGFYSISKILTVGPLKHLS